MIAMLLMMMRTIVMIVMLMMNDDDDSDDDICMGVWLREGNRGRADDQLFP